MLKSLRFQLRFHIAYESWAITSYNIKILYRFIHYEPSYLEHSRHNDSWLMIHVFLIRCNVTSPLFEVNRRWIQTKITKRTQFHIWYKQWIWWCFQAISLCSNSTDQNTKIFKWRNCRSWYLWPSSRWENSETFTWLIPRHTVLCQFTVFPKSLVSLRLKLSL